LVSLERGSQPANADGSGATGSLPASADSQAASVVLQHPFAVTAVALADEPPVAPKRDKKTDNQRIA